MESDLLRKIDASAVEKFGEKEYEAVLSKEEFKVDLAMALSTKREALGLSQTDMAKEIHTTQQQISKYEKSSVSPTIERLYEMCKVLGLEIIIKDKEQKKELLHY